VRSPWEGAQVLPSPILLDWGEPRTALVLPQRKRVWKSYQHSSSLFLSTHSVLYSVWLQVGAFDIRGKMAGSENVGEEFMDTPRT